MKYVVQQGCTYCNTCIFECPVGAIEMTAAGAQIDQATCIGCGQCQENCASEAIVALVAAPPGRPAGIPPAPPPGAVFTPDTAGRHRT